MNFFRKVSLFALLIGLAISQPTVEPDAGDGISFTNGGNVFRVQEESAQPNQNLELTEFFSLLTGPAGALDVALFDSQKPLNNELILNRLFRLRVRSIVEFDDVGEPGFEFETDEPVQVYRFGELTWNRWDGPNTIDTGLHRFTSNSVGDQFGALGVVDLEASDLLVDSSAQELNSAIQNANITQLQALNLTSGLAANLNAVIVGTSESAPGTSAAGTSPGTSPGTSQATDVPNPSVETNFNTADFISFTDVGIERQENDSATLIQSIQSLTPEAQVLGNPTTFWFQKIDFTSLYRGDVTKIAIQLQLSFSQYLRFRDLVLTLPSELNPRAIISRFGPLPKFVQTSDGTLIPVIISDFRAVFSPIPGESRFIFFATIDTQDHGQAFFNLTLLRAQGGRYTGSLEELFENVQANDSAQLNPTSFIQDEAPAENLVAQDTADPLDNFTLPSPILNLFAALDSAQAGLEPTDSEGSGTGTFTLDTSTNQFCATNMQLTNVNDVVDITLHGPAAAGEQAPTVFAVGTETTFCLSVLSEQANEISDGLWYVLIRTASFPEGEVRGQILPLVSEQTQAPPTQAGEITA